jgi:hypothetical protein
VTVDAETRAFILEAVKSTVQETLKKAPRPIFKPAVVASVDTESTLPQVVCDGPDERPFGAQLLSGAVFPGDRVEIMFLDPHGAFIVGRRGGDYDPWHVIGSEEEPQFEDPGGGGQWIHNTGTVGLGQDGPPQVMFRRLYRLVELRGIAGRTAGAGINIFFLPPDYRPENDLSYFQPYGVATGIVTVYRSGLVEATSGNPGNGVNLAGILFSTNFQDTLAA